MTKILLGLAMTVSFLAVTIAMDPYKELGVSTRASAEQIKKVISFLFIPAFHWMPIAINVLPVSMRSDDVFLTQKDNI